MADLPFPESKAEQYVLGQLTPAERREFETLLHQSPELRALVGDLEAGLTALALSAPPLKAPREAWQNIAAKTTPRSRWNLWQAFFGLKWLVNGWAAATCLTVVVIMKVAWNHHAAPINVAARDEDDGQPVVMTSNGASITQTSRTGAKILSPAGLDSPMHAVRNDKSTTTVAGNVSAAGVRPQLAAANALQLVPPPKMIPSTHVKLSPRMQRAMLLAVARQMGWDTPDNNHPAPATGATGATDDIQPPANDPTEQKPTTDPTIDFVDMTGSTMVSETDQSPVYGPETMTTFPQAQGAGSLSLLQSGPDVFAFVDPADLPPKTGPLTVWLSDPSDTGVPMGTVHIHRPTVIVLPSLPSGYQYYITTGTSNYILARYPTARDLEMESERMDGN